MQLEVEISKFDTPIYEETEGPEALFRVQLRKLVIGPFAERL